MAKTAIKTLLDSRQAGEEERLLRIVEEASEEWWRGLTQEQREVLVAMDYDGMFFIMRKINEAGRKKEGR